MSSAWSVAARARHRRSARDGRTYRAVVARTLEPTDTSGRLHTNLVLWKLAAGQLKDNELVAALIDRELVDLDTVRTRIGSIADLHLRAVLLARLQIVLESADIE
jgi:hypothetical protein